MRRARSSARGGRGGRPTVFRTLLVLTSLAIAVGTTPSTAPAYMRHAGAAAAGIADAGAAPAHRHETGIDEVGARGPGASMFEVGTAESPLVTRPGQGPLLAAHRTRPFRARAALAASFARGATAAPRLRSSTRCRKLLARKSSRLSGRDRARRRACTRIQRRLMAENARRDAPSAGPSTTSTTAPAKAPGVSAPAAPVKGPMPVSTPPATPAPTPSAAKPVAATPTPSPAPPSAGTPVYAAAGVTAIDGGEKFRLTRDTARADIVNFELVNTDSQQHDLWIAAADENGDVSGSPVQIIGRTDGQVDGRPTRASTDMTLAPGRYVLLCTVPGHGRMTVPFTVYAPTR